MNDVPSSCFAFVKNTLNNTKQVISGMRLRYRLLLFAVVVLIPMVVFGILSVFQSVNNAKDQTMNSSLAMAKVVASNIVEKIDNTERLLQGLAQSSTVKTQNIKETRNLLIDIFPVQSDLVNLAAVDENGSVYADIVWYGSRPRNLANDEYFQQALLTGEPTISGSLISEATDQRVVRMTVPIRAEENRIIGALMADISLSQVQRKMVSIGIEEGTTVIVTDSNGTVLLHPNYKIVYDEENFVNSLAVQAALNGKEGVGEYPNPLDNHSWLWAYTPIRKTGWAVLVGYPTAVAYPSIRDILLRGVLMLLIMIMLAVLVAVYLSNRLSRPLRDLTRRALSISEGDLHQETRVEGSQEVRQLGQAFNLMSRNLSKHMNELALAKEENLREAKRLQSLLTRTISLQEEERRRIASDMHDSTSQLILGSLYEIEASKEMILTNPELAKEKLTGVEYLLEQTSMEMRRAIYDLRPQLLDDMGLAMALDRCIARFIETTGIQIMYECRGTGIRFLREAELALYRIAQEALTNIHKHSHSDQGLLQLDFHDHTIRMAIKDEGVGFDPNFYLSGKSEHLGLKSMIERAESVGAHLEINSSPGHGVEIICDYIFYYESGE